MAMEIPSQNVAQCQCLSSYQSLLRKKTSFCRECRPVPQQLQHIAHPKGFDVQGVQAHHQGVRPGGGPPAVRAQEDRGPELVPGVRREDQRAKAGGAAEAHAQRNRRRHSHGDTPHPTTATTRHVSHMLHIVAAIVTQKESHELESSPAIQQPAGRG